MVSLSKEETSTAVAAPQPFFLGGEGCYFSVGTGI